MRTEAEVRDKLNKIKRDLEVTNDLYEYFVLRIKQNLLAWVLSGEETKATN